MKDTEKLNSSVSFKRGDVAGGNYQEDTYLGETKLYKNNNLIGSAIFYGLSTILDVEEFDGAWLGEKLINAIAVAQNGFTIDCRRAEIKQIHERVVIDKAVTIILPYGEIACSPANGVDIFDIQSDNVSIVGQGRAEDNLTVTGTYIVMMNGRYHVYSRGHSLLTLSDFSCFGTKSFTEPRDSVKNLDGHGGIYIEKINPGTVEANNNVNGIVLENLLVHGTYAHGVYVDTPILSLFKNIRISNTAGHGFFCWGGTSSTWQNCYVLSADYAGFCLYQHTYGSLSGCSSEYTGIGYWSRSCNSVTYNGCGVEYATNRGGTVYSLGLTTTDELGDPVDIPDISSDYIDIFRGNSFVVTGGAGVLYNTVRSSNPSQPHQTAGTSSSSRHILIKGNARNITFWNPTLGMSVGETYSGRFDIEISNLAIEYPSGILLQYNPENGTVVPVISDYITDTDNSAFSTFILSTIDELHVQDGNIIYSYLRFHNIKSGADSVSAGVTTEGEVWRTLGHATLPDGVLMVTT